MRSSNHPNAQEQLIERAKKEQEKLEQYRQEQMRALYDALFASLKAVKSSLQCTFNSIDCEFYKATFTDSKLIANLDAYLDKAKACGLDITELDNAKKQLTVLCQPSGQSIAELDVYIQDHIIDPVWNFQYHQIEHPGQKPVLAETTFPVEELPKEIANYVIAFTRQPTHTSARLATVNKPSHGLFQPEIGKNAARDAAECAINPTQENVEKLKILVAGCPSLLLHPVIVKNRHDMLIKGSVYQIALHESDNELIDDVIKPAFEKLPNGLETMEAQRKTWLPDGWMEAEEKTCENACQAIDEIFTAFNKASDPNDVTELPQQPYTITVNNQAVNQALDVFRAAINALYQPTDKAIVNGRDPITRLIERVMDRYKEHYDALGGFNTPRNNALMRAVYGYCQRFAPINFMQAFAMGIYNLVENKKKLIRSFEYRNWAWHFILPLDSDPLFRLGYEYYGDTGVGSTGGLGGATGITKLFVNQKQLQLYSPALCRPGHGIAQ